ncbi:MAG: MBL fold metallo-hydrolase [Candidatus Paceibacterota bacterium]|jgi:competence protein ComEC
MKLDNFSLLLILALIFLNIFVWYQIVFVGPNINPILYFLNIGQGDSELIVLPQNVKIITDAGPDSKIVRELDKIISPSERYFDIALITHAQLDHFNGFNYLLKNYSVGTFITNGQTADLPEWKEFEKNAKEKNIPIITLISGDKIKSGKNFLSIISPTNELLQSSETNDSCMVIQLETENLSVLYTCDIDSTTEKYLVKNFSSALNSVILKVPHHGSKYSSSNEFLDAVQPKIAIIEVGAKNSYGHPTEEALARLTSSTIKKIFRTDQDGTIKIITADNKLQIYELKY